ncbi:MAG: hypothetical protein M1840_007117 [Geoglossum simile]|nr:MAG: hypothetical protein M1840_007117 [Geoglossum simile]
MNMSLGQDEVAVDQLCILMKKPVGILLGATEHCIPNFRGNRQFYAQLRPTKSLAYKNQRRTYNALITTVQHNGLIVRRKTYFDIIKFMLPVMFSADANEDGSSIEDDSMKHQNTHLDQMLLGSNNGWNPSNEETSITLGNSAPSGDTGFEAISLPENSVPGNWVDVLQYTVEDEGLYHALWGVASIFL